MHIKNCSQSGPCKPGAGSGGAYKASYKPPSRTHPAGLRDRDQPWVSETFHRIPEISGGSCFHIPSSVPAEKSLRWAVFMRKCEPKEAVLVLKALKLDNDTIYQVKVLTGWIERSICGEIALPDEMCTRENAAELEFMPGAESKPRSARS